MRSCFLLLSTTYCKRIHILIHYFDNFSFENFRYSFAISSVICDMVSNGLSRFFPFNVSPLAGFTRSLNLRSHNYFCFLFFILIVFNAFLVAFCPINFAFNWFVRYILFFVFCLSLLRVCLTRVCDKIALQNIPSFYISLSMYRSIQLRFCLLL